MTESTSLNKHGHYTSHNNGARPPTTGENCKKAYR
jgi:hypothetical protein